MCAWQVYYKDAFGAMLVYDISRSQTFETVAKVRQTTPTCVCAAEARGGRMEAGERREAGRLADHVYAGRLTAVQQSTPTTNLERRRAEARA